MEIDSCVYGLWTNGLEFFFVKKKATKFQIDAEPIGDWPPGDESIGTRDVLSHAKARRAQPTRKEVTPGPDHPWSRTFSVRSGSLSHSFHAASRSALLTRVFQWRFAKPSLEPYEGHAPHYECRWE